MSLTQTAKKRKTSSLLILLFIILIIVGIGVGVFVFFENEKPSIQLTSQIDFIGNETSINFSVTDKKSGLQSIHLTLIQGEMKKTLYSIDFPRQRYWLNAGPGTKEVSCLAVIKKLGFKDGEAKLVIEATDYSFLRLLRGNKTRIEKTITIDTKPPRINILHSERYVKPGGTGFVIYRLSNDAQKHGVMINKTFHLGFPIEDGREDVYNSLFAVPYNVKKLTETHIMAVDRAGNQAIVPFSTRLQKTKQKKDRINISNSFLNTKIPEFDNHYPEMQGTPLEKYLYANNKIRSLNNQTIKTVCKKSVAERLWKDRFLRMSGSSKAGFADHRTYFYKNKGIDKQVHLGMDIASTKRVEVKAAGTGKVVLAEYLGIYGNTVILDHGQGLFSLYAHMSQINMAIDDIVEKGSVIGLTGTTGMAGGDHLHFSMLVNGIFVTPIEWWDQHWIEVTIQEPIIDSKF